LFGVADACQSDCNTTSKAAREFDGLNVFDVWSDILNNLGGQYVVVTGAGVLNKLSLRKVKA